MPEETHISKLYLFSKNTDAVETVRGYKYQELKTLETWLNNHVNGHDEIIYCDYEEDIFQRDLDSFSSKFRQLKLYSSNFSFASEEVTKALSHFFMLFVSGEYLLDEITFVFESNSEIARKYGDNEAELLKEWDENQESLEGELLDRCITKVRSIIDAYIADAYERLKDQDDINALIAKETYENLPIEHWETFVKSIRWNFSGISPEEAIQSSIQNSLSLISELQFPIASDDYPTVFDRLRGAVSDKSIEKEPENRVLTNELLSIYLLSLGSQDDQEYLTSWEAWSLNSEIETFNIGEFYRVLFSSKHCRRNIYLKDHDQLWLDLLHRYVEIAGNRKFEKEAIYEIIWLTIRPKVDEAPTRNINSLKELVQNYFSDFSENTILSAFEDTLNLLTIISTSQKLQNIDLNDEEINKWFQDLDTMLETQQKNPLNNDHLCSILELRAFCLMNAKTLDVQLENDSSSEEYFGLLIDLIPESNSYAVSHLGNRIKGFIELANAQGLEYTEVDLPLVYEKLIPFISQREGDFSAAKSHVELGISYINSSSNQAPLKAMDHFHKAKDLYQNEDTNEGYFLALINLSQLYSSIGMNLAARHYALVCVWYAIHTDTPELLRRLSQAYSLLTHYDIKQGSWINSIYQFECFIKTRDHSMDRIIGLGEDLLFQKTVVDMAVVLQLTKELSPQLTGYIDHECNQMDSLFTEFIQPISANISEQPQETKDQIIEDKLDNPPINDIGDTRKLSWKALGVDWHVSFSNDWKMNSIGEEFCALMQVIQSEIALRSIDFHLLNEKIEIEIELSNVIKEPEQIASNNELKWKAFIPELTEPVQEAKNAHYTKLTVTLQFIMDEISLLPSQEFSEGFMNMFREGIGNRALVVNAYQRIYRDLVSEEKFNEVHRNGFNSFNFGRPNKVHDALRPAEGLSEKYNHEEALEAIEGRYNNCLRAIHLTLDRLLQNQAFVEKVRNYRGEGWMDWQILLGLYNHIIDLKAKNILRQNGKQYPNNEEWLADFQKVFHSIRLKDESITYVEIPFEVILSDELDLQIESMPSHTLNSYGLKSEKSRYPNFKAIRTFLISRMNFNEDDIPGLSPLTGIN